jgi:hypothetical protein
MLIKNIGLFINTLIIIDDYALLLKIELTEGKIYLKIGFCRTFLSYLTLVQSLLQYSLRCLCAEGTRQKNS